MRKFILLTFSFILLINFTFSQSSMGHGTTMLTWVTADSIVIAADSRIMIGREGENMRESVMCKIGHRQNLFFGIAGWTIEFNESGAPTFDLLKVLDSCAMVGKSLENTCVLFKKIALDFFKGIGEKDEFPPMPSPGSYNLAYFTIAAIQNGRLLHSDYDIHATKRDDGAISISIALKKYSNIPHLARGGHTDSVDSYLTRHPRSLSDDAPKALRQIVALEAKGHRDVGGPINVLVIRRTGFAWTQGSKPCF